MARPRDISSRPPLYEVHALLSVLPHHPEHKLAAAKDFVHRNNGHHRKLADRAAFPTNLCVPTGGQVVGYDAEGHLPVCQHYAGHEQHSQCRLGLHHLAASFTHHLASLIASEAETGFRGHILPGISVSAYPQNSDARLLFFLLFQN